MHVTIEINGRQALPVRTIPLLTDWRGLSPDQLAQILAGDSDHWPSFDGLTAYRLHPDGSTEPISPRWWASWVVGKLEATSNTIKAKQTSRATGRQQWRGDSLAQLPAGVFVWLDEFEAAHASQYGPVGWLARSNPDLKLLPSDAEGEARAMEVMAESMGPAYRRAPPRTGARSSRWTTGRAWKSSSSTRSCTVDRPRMRTTSEES